VDAWGYYFNVRQSFMCGRVRKEHLPWKVYAPTSASTTCNGWSIHMQEEGWGATTMNISDDVENLLVADLAFSHDKAQGVEHGAADVCLGPSACYNLNVRGASTARWSILDAQRVVVASGSAPYSRKLCHCGHHGGSACSNCSGATMHIPPPPPPATVPTQYIKITQDGPVGAGRRGNSWFLHEVECWDTTASHSPKKMTLTAERASHEHFRTRYPMSAAVDGAANRIHASSLIAVAES